MTQKAVRSIVIALVIALIGLTCLQVMLLGTARDLEEQSFRSAVQAALNEATDRLETTEATMTAIMIAEERHDSTSWTVINHSKGIQLHHFDKDNNSPTVHWEGDTLICFMPVAQRIKMGNTGSNGLPGTIMLDTFLTSGEHRLHPQLSENNDHRYFYRFMADDSVSWERTEVLLFDSVKLPPDGDQVNDINFHYRLIADDTVGWIRQDMRIVDSGQSHGTFMFDVETGLGGALSDSGRFDFVQEIVARLTMGESQPIAERLDLALLDSVLSLSLTEAGISLAYEFGVRSGERDSLEFMSDPIKQADLLGSEFYSGLFTRDFGGSPADLILFFPDRELFLWQQIWPMALAAAFLMAVIVLCFVYTIRTIFDQRRNASLMVDFVNNMTHEFKTPISTVALACEAILREDVIDDRTKVAKFGAMIQTENRRMRHQAEKILQMAALEEKDHTLKLQPVDLHTVLSEAIDNITLRVESRKGEVECELGAEQSLVMADPIHLSGIINNLLDNALKYSPDQPRISVRTSVIGQRLIIKFADQGVGLKAEDRERIFDKYYRVSQGDLHDVKGFGLGLSYVKLMIAAHHGNIEVASTFGRGTTIRLSFPLTAITEESA